MRLLQRTFEVETRYGGGFVQAIDGVGGGRRGGRPVDWFFYVNGIEADERRRRAAKLARRRPRVVGPPRLGRRDARPGRRRLLPRAVRVRARRASGCRCGSSAREPRSARATRSRTRLEDAGAKVGGVVGARARERGPEVLRVLVGPLGRASAATRPRAALERGPKATGVFARPAADGRPHRRCSTRAARPCGRSAPGAGLVAATQLRRPAADLGRDRHRRRRASPPRRAGARRGARCATTSRSPSRTAARSPLPLRAETAP